MPGEGYEKPNDAAKVVLNVESAQTAGDLAGFAAKTLETSDVLRAGRAGEEGFPEEFLLFVEFPDFGAPVYIWKWGAYPSTASWRRKCSIFWTPKPILSLYVD